ncbi:MAG: SH3 domain-containing protein [Bacteriovorax sp.]
MKYIFLITISMISASAFSQEADIGSSGMKRSIIGIKYFSQLMGNVHQNPSRYSQVLTTISCNHPLKAMKETSKDGKEFILYGENKWNLVKVGPYEGYVMSDYLSDKKNECFEEQYPKFFDGLSLDINDLYYWARLYDQYVQGKSKVRQ